MVDGYTYWIDSTKLVLTGVEEKKILPTVYDLQQNYPNPFNPTTVISYQLPVNGYVTLKVFDLLGREVAVLVNEKKEARSHTVHFDGSGLSSGVYFYQLRGGDFVKTRKLILQK
jgi:hypothetical protein